MEEHELEGISTEEWKQALAEIERDNEYPDAMTRMELEDLFGLGTLSTRKKIRKLIKAGIMECVGYVKRTNVVGEDCKKPGYRIKMEDKNDD